MNETFLHYTSPNLKYDHVFVICRYDSYLPNSTTNVSEIIDAMTVVKVYADELTAQRETERLNNLISEKNLIGDNHSLYFMRMGKMPKGLLNNQ